MSDSPEPISNSSQLACYCTELERLASTLTGMLSQCEALGSPLAEDRPAVERLVPIVGDLQKTMVTALNADAEHSLQDDVATEDSIPLVRTTGARFIEWHNGEGQTAPNPPADNAGDSTSAVAECAEPTVATDEAESSEDTGRLPTDANGDLAPNLASDLLALDSSDAEEKPFPSVDRCAEILMSDLSAECIEDMHDKGEVTLQGTNESLPLPSVFQFLGQTTKSGTLRVKTNQETMKFEVVLGDLVFSTTDTPPRDQLLGEILIAMGFVSRENLENTLARIGEDKTRLGTVLEDEQLVSLDDLRRALKAQIKNRLERAFEAPESAFTFSEGGPDRPHHRIKMNVTQLLLESL